MPGGYEQSLMSYEPSLFGYGYSAERYAAVLDGCALRPDLAILPAGDGTHVGERGVSLSGVLTRLYDTL